MITVRPYTAADKEDVEKICLINADADSVTDDPGFSRYILLLYCDYYLEKEPGNCFVAVDSVDNRPVGYIICSENYTVYEKIFRDEYLPEIAKLSARRYVNAEFEMLAHSMFAPEYNAHFHIDVDPHYQRLGIGSLLVSTLEVHLLRRGLKGMMLVCGEDNAQAISFYKKNGFKDLMTTKMGHAMALDFEAKENDIC